MYILQVGMIRFVWEFSFPSVPCGEKATKEKPDIIAKVHYLHFGAILFAFVLIFVAVLSLLTEEPPEYRYAGLTYFTLNLPFIEHVVSIAKQIIITLSPPFGGFIWSFIHLFCDWH